MLRRKRTRRVFTLIAPMLVFALLACSPLEGLVVDLGPSVEITEPATGTSVEVGQAVQIASTAEAKAGIARVELLVDGSRVQEDEPQTGNPPSFRLIQTWLPLAEGEYEISVVAYDANGKASDEASIVLLVGAGAAEAETPTPTATVDAGACTLDAAFVADVSIPIDTEVAPGSSFLKGWRVQNTGTCDWDAGFSLVFASGEQMGGPASVPVPQTGAGAMVDLSVQLEAPLAYGTHSGQWRLRSDEGQIFGAVLTVQIIVPAPPTATPTVTPTPLPTDTPTPTPTGFMPIVTLWAPTLMVPIFFPYTQHVSTTVTVPAGSWAAATASCPSGSLLVGGGYDAHWNVHVYSQYMPTTSDWRVAAWNHGGSSMSMIVYAVCLRNVSGTISSVSNTKNGSAGGWTKVVATCPAGTIVTGGGWGVSSSGDMVVYNSSKLGNGWQIYGYNTGSSASSLTARAVCLADTSGSVSTESNSVSLGSGGVGEVECSCSSGLNVSGGFAGPFQYADFYITSPDLSVSGQWSNWARNTATSSKNFYCYANCLEL